jgi:DegV family protein with EDD domain
MIMEGKIMSKVVIVTDSTAYIPEEKVKEYDITVIPIPVIFEDGVMDDGFVDLREFFNRVERSSKLPYTSHPSVDKFVEVYEKLVKEEGREVVSIHISSKLSETVNTARIAAKMVDENKISVVDSLQVLGPMGYQVLVAAEAAKAWLTRPQIVGRAEKVRDEISFYCIPATLDYLKKGGRIGGAEALFGKLLQIRPVLCLRNGRVEIVGKVRTWDKAVERILQEMPRDSSSLRVGVGHALAQKDMEQIKQTILEKAPAVAVDTWTLGPAIGIHIGPGAVGIAYWNQNQGRIFLDSLAWD